MVSSIDQQVKKKSKPGQPKVRMERSALDVDGNDYDNDYDDFIWISEDIILTSAVKKFDWFFPIWKFGQ